MVSRAAQTHLAGLMRPAGRVFETPALRVTNYSTNASLFYFLDVTPVLWSNFFELALFLANWNTNENFIFFLQQKKTLK